ncbi:MAG: choice-of-anchor tandem repeat GloVer-containing protein [Stellaceae bacterium]
MRIGSCLKRARVGQVSALTAAVLTVGSLALPNGAAAAFGTLYSFCSRGGKNCTDGAHPQDGLIRDASGKLYGTTSGGGAHGAGNVFELTPNAAKTKWTEAVLYNFCSRGGRNCTDGAVSLAGVIRDASGKLYGTTYVGGAQNRGTVFELTPNAVTPNGTHTKWTEKVLYSFCSQGAGAACTDGASPIAALVIDASGRLYGTTYEGGAHNWGTVFALTPNAAKTKWTEAVLHSFCSQGGTGCTDGAHLYAGLIKDASGKLYGTTAQGGADKLGTVFELTPNAKKTKWTYGILHSFCSQIGCTDGSLPTSGLIMDASGKLYGTTVAGGAHGNEGAAFELTPNAKKTKWTETVLYSFCSRACRDGAVPAAAVVRDASGHLYGTTEEGGAHYSTSTYGGTLFELTPNAAKTKWTESVLYNFCAKGGKNCTDGTLPAAAVIIDPSGGLYSTTYQGGAHGSGTVFELKR